MATAPDQIMIWVRNFTDTSPPTLPVQEGANQTFVKGELVNLVGGYAKEITTDIPNAIYAIADEPAHNDAVDGTHEIAVTLVLPTQIFEANMKQAGLADHVSVASDFGVTMAIQRDTVNNKIFLNASTKGPGSLLTRVFVHVPRDQSKVGDTNIRAHFSFIPNWIQALATS